MNVGEWVATFQQTTSWPWAQILGRRPDELRFIGSNPSRKQEPWRTPHRAYARVRVCVGRSRAVRHGLQQETLNAWKYTTSVECRRALPQAQLCSSDVLSIHVKCNTSAYGRDSNGANHVPPMSSRCMKNTMKTVHACSPKGSSKRVASKRRFISDGAMHGARVRLCTGRGQAVGNSSPLATIAVCLTG